MTSLACRFFAQIKCPLLMWISARILDVGEMSLYTWELLMTMRIGKSRDIQALGWCPSAIVIRVQFSLVVFYKQPECILSI